MDYFEYVYESLFKEYSDLNSNVESKMPDYITTLGLHAIKLNKGTFAETAIDILSRLSLHVIQFDKSEYSATRIAVRILMIEVYAMERDNEEIVSHVRKKTKELTIQHNNDKKIDKSMLKAEAQRQGEELQYDVLTDFLNESPDAFGIVLSISLQRITGIDHIGASWSLHIAAPSVGKRKSRQG
jgi:hypothetical protein